VEDGTRRGKRHPAAAHTARDRPGHDNKTRILPIAGRMVEGRPGKNREPKTEPVAPKATRRTSNLCYWRAAKEGIEQASKPTDV